MPYNIHLFLIMLFVIMAGHLHGPCMCVRKLSSSSTFRFDCISVSTFVYLYIHVCMLVKLVVLEFIVFYLVYIPVAMILLL